MSTAILTSPKRCAVYCRVSSDERLDQSFNSIDAQKEAGHAFIKSQIHEGWIAVADDRGTASEYVRTRTEARVRLLALLDEAQHDLVEVGRGVDHHRVAGAQRTTEAQRDRPSVGAEDDGVGAEITAGRRDDDTLGADITHAGDVDPVDQDVAGRWRLEAGQHAQQRGLSAARAAEDAEQLATVDVQVDGVDGDEIAEALRYLPDLYQRIRSGLVLVNGRYRPL